jgi:hypothetical protein
MAARKVAEMSLTVADAGSPPRRIGKKMVLLMAALEGQEGVPSGGGCWGASNEEHKKVDNFYGCPDATPNAQCWKATCM